MGRAAFILLLIFFGISNVLTVKVEPIMCGGVVFKYEVEGKDSVTHLKCRLDSTKEPGTGMNTNMKLVVTQTAMAFDGPSEDSVHTGNGNGVIYCIQDNCKKYATVSDFLKVNASKRPIGYEYKKPVSGQIIHYHYQMLEKAPGDWKFKKTDEATIKLANAANANKITCVDDEKLIVACPTKDCNNDANEAKKLCKVREVQCNNVTKPYALYAKERKDFTIRRCHVEMKAEKDEWTIVNNGDFTPSKDSKTPLICESQGQETMRVSCIGNNCDKNLTIDSVKTICKRKSIVCNGKLLFNKADDTDDVKIRRCLVEVSASGSKWISKSLGESITSNDDKSPFFCEKNENKMQISCMEDNCDKKVNGTIATTACNRRFTKCNGVLSFNANEDKDPANSGKIYRRCLVEVSAQGDSWVPKILGKSELSDDGKSDFVCVKNEEKMLISCKGHDCDKIFKGDHAVEACNRRVTKCNGLLSFNVSEDKDPANSGKIHRRCLVEVSAQGDFWVPKILGKSELSDDGKSDFVCVQNEEKMLISCKGHDCDKIFKGDHAVEACNRRVTKCNGLLSFNVSEDKDKANDKKLHRRCIVKMSPGTDAWNKPEIVGHSIISDSNEAVRCEVKNKDEMTVSCYGENCDKNVAEKEITDACKRSSIVCGGKLYQNASEDKSLKIRRCVVRISPVDGTWKREFSSKTSYATSDLFCEGRGDSPAISCTGNNCDDKIADSTILTKCNRKAIVCNGKITQNATEDQSDNYKLRRCTLTLKPGDKSWITIPDGESIKSNDERDLVCHRDQGLKVSCKGDNCEKSVNPEEAAKRCRLNYAYCGGKLSFDPSEHTERRCIVNVVPGKDKFISVATEMGKASKKSEKKDSLVCISSDKDEMVVSCHGKACDNLLEHPEAGAKICKRKFTVCSGELKYNVSEDNEMTYTHRRCRLEGELIGATWNIGKYGDHFASNSTKQFICESNDAKNEVVVSCSGEKCDDPINEEDLMRICDFVEPQKEGSTEKYSTSAILISAIVAFYF